MLHFCCSFSLLRLRTLLLGCIAFLTACHSAGGENRLKGYDHYAVQPADPTDPSDVQWADYLRNHLAKRLGANHHLVGTTPTDKSLTLVVDFEKAEQGDYAWQWNDKRLTLSAGNKRAMLWLLYQTIENIGQVDKRIVADDLPLPSQDMQGDRRGTLPFEYASIYSPFHRNEDLFGVTGVGNLDFDWALWGHNLHKIIGDSLPDEIYAQVDGQPNKEQYCFSSEALYQCVETYILDQYGDGTKESARFVIMPNDNHIVCHCPKCQAAGNTATSATPAVAKMITRLAQRFPLHQFFTSYYATTAQVPDTKLPDNVGVLISAIDLPMMADLSKSSEAQAFNLLVHQWRTKVGRVYVWDYMRNFDDYLSPFPFLTAAKSRLNFFKEAGVSGVIYNGSGEDYAAFDPMQSSVLASLLLDPTLDISDRVTAELQRRYPETHQIIADYYLGLEARTQNDNQPLPFYGGIGDLVETYLDPEAFTSFFESLEKASKPLKGDERRELNRLLTALNFTRLQLLRLPQLGYDATKASIYIENLAGHTAFPDLSVFREAKGSLTSYMANYEARPAQIATSGAVKCVSYPELTDGYVGLPIDYHTNWFITPREQDVLTLEMQLQQPVGQLSISTLHAPLWGIYWPAKAELWQDGNCVGTSKPLPAPQGEFQQIDLQLPYRGKRDTPYELRIHRAPRAGKNTMSFDEITD